MKNTGVAKVEFTCDLMKEYVRFNTSSFLILCGKWTSFFFFSQLWKGKPNQILYVEKFRAAEAANSHCRYSSEWVFFKKDSCVGVFLNLFQPGIAIFTTLAYQKTFSFIMFSGGLVMEH